MYSRIKPLIAIALGLGTAVTHAEVCPTSPVSLIAPAQPGGLTDLVARITAPALAKALKQNVIVVNRPGAGGAVGAASLAQGAPDGCTLLIGITSLSTFPEQERLNGRPSVFQLAQLKAVARLTLEPMILVTHAESPWRNVADLLAAARKDPGRVSYATTGPYGTYHVAVEQWASAARLKLGAIPYNGGGAALQALLRKDVDFSIVSRAVGSSQLAAGKLKALAVWGDQRLSELPTVPTLKESGLQGDYALWTGLFAPTGVSPALMASLQEAVRTAVADPEFKAAAARMGSEVGYLDAEAFGEFWRADAQRLSAVVTRIGPIQ